MLMGLLPFLRHRRRILRRRLTGSLERAATSMWWAAHLRVVFVTYVQTSALFAFPDYISVKFIEIDANTSTLAVFSRSRLGKNDLGVNKKRVTAWLDQLP